MAFVAESPSGFTEIWIRDLDSREVRKLEGTSGARDLFWSPDSRFVGYFSDEFVWKIEIASGAVEKLAAISQTRGGAWNRQGKILIGGSKLVSVPATGGEPTTVVERDHETGENALRFPHYLPDGNHVLYYSRNAEGSDRAGLWSVALDTGNRKHLAPEATSSAIYVEPGALLYRRDRYLVARPFDATTLEFTGASSVVDENLWYEPGVTAQTNVSASKTGTVTFRTGGPEVTELTWFDRQGNRTGTVWEPKGFITVGLSHDEKQLITGFPGQGVNREVWLYDIATASSSADRSTRRSGRQCPVLRRRLASVASTVHGRQHDPLDDGAGQRRPPEDPGGEVRIGRCQPTGATTRSSTQEIVGRCRAVVSERSRPGVTGEDRTIIDAARRPRHSARSRRTDAGWPTRPMKAGSGTSTSHRFPDGGRRWRISTAGGHQPRWNPQRRRAVFPLVRPED